MHVQSDIIGLLGAQGTGVQGGDSIWILSVSILKVYDLLKSNLGHITVVEQQIRGGGDCE